MGRIATIASALLLACIHIGAVSAQTLPNRPITIVSPTAPGGAIDVVGRLIAAEMQEVLGRSFVIDNRSGAGQKVGTIAVARAEPDGTTLLLGTNAAMSTNPAIEKNIGYDPATDFVPIGAMVWYPFLVVLHPSVPATNIAELIAYAKQNPGKIHYGSAGRGSGTHFAGELFRANAKIDIVHVPYRGLGPAYPDLLSGRIHLLFDTGSAMGNVKKGDLRLLAVSTAQRSPLFPDTPTMIEAGVPDYRLVSWGGLFAPKGTPPQVVATLSDAMRQVLTKENVRKRLIELNMEPRYMSGPELAEYMRADLAMHRDIVVRAGLSAD